MIKDLKKDFSVLVFVGLIFILLPFLNSSCTVDPETLPRILILSLFVEIYLFYYFVDFFRRKGTNSFSFVISPIIICFLLYSIVAVCSIVNAINLGDSIFEVLKLFFYFTLIVLVAHLIKEKQDRLTIVIKAVSLSVIIFSCYGAFQLYTSYKFAIDYHTKFKISYSLNSTLSNKNVYSEVLFLSLPFTLYGFISLKSFWKYLTMVNIFITIISLIVLMNVYVWLAIIVSFLVFSVCFIFDKRKEILFINSKKHTRLFLLFLSVALFIGVIFFSRFSGLQQVQTKLSHLIQYVKTPEQIEKYDIIGNDNNIHERILLVKNTTRMIGDNLLTGVGIGNWKIKEPSYGQVSITNSIRVDYPHNDFLSVFAELGILGFFCFILFFIFNLRLAYKFFKSSNNFSDALLGLLMFCSLLGYIIISFFGFSKEKFFPMVFLSFMVGISIAKFPTLYKMPNLLFKKVLFGFLIVVVGFLIFVGSIRIQSEVHLQRALKAKKFKLWSTVIREINEVNSFYYPVDFASTPLVWYKGSAFYYENKLDSALCCFNQAIKLNPFHLHVLNDLATCYENKGNHKMAISYFQKAYKLNPNYIRKNLVAAYFNGGELESAYDLATSEHYNNTVFLEEILREKVKQFGETQNDPALKQYVFFEMQNIDWLVGVYKESKSKKKKINEVILNFFEKNTEFKKK